jgi:hypothetical protein
MCGVSWIAHLDPFHRSASETPPLVYPTASQNFEEGHETAVSIACLDLAACWTNQRPTFNRSISAPDRSKPTAVHALVELHEIAVNPLLPKPAGFGFGLTDHTDPFDRTSSGDRRWALPVNAGPATWVNDPTAEHCLREGHDTPVSSDSVVPASRQP